MERQIEERLLHWKQDKKKKPLLIKGARQVGKTYSIRKFAKEQYQEVVEINFERDLRYIDLFRKTHNPNEILDYLRLSFMEYHFNENTIFFMDEIQACPDALTALKFLNESFPCDIICSGSMLGVAISQSSSYPVGYVETWEMFPMSFLEFLKASAIPSDILFKINQSLAHLEAIPEVIHEKMNELFTTYLIIGGMPEVIAKYIEVSSLRDCLLIQRRIVNDYKNDMAKYAIASDKIKVRECFASIPLQLAKENRKFQYGVVKKGYNARYYDSALRWLEDSGVILKVNRLAHIASPLASEVELAIFKVYMADVGLFVSQLEDGDIKKIIGGDLGIYKGVLYENVAAQILKQKGKSCYYYEPSQFSEIDFVISYEGNITPIEIKAGMHTTSKSFQNFVNQYKPEQAFRFSQKNIGVTSDGEIKFLPLYLLEVILDHEASILF